MSISKPERDPRSYASNSPRISPGLPHRSQNDCSPGFTLIIVRILDMASMKKHPSGDELMRPMALCANATPAARASLSPISSRLFSRWPPLSTMPTAKTYSPAMSTENMLSATTTNLAQRLWPRSRRHELYLSASANTAGTVPYMGSPNNSRARTLFQRISMLWLWRSMNGSAANAPSMALLRKSPASMFSPFPLLCVIASPIFQPRRTGCFKALAKESQRDASRRFWPLRTLSNRRLQLPSQPYSPPLSLLATSDTLFSCTSTSHLESNDEFHTLPMMQVETRGGYRAEKGVEPPVGSVRRRPEPSSKRRVGSFARALKTTVFDGRWKIGTRSRREREGRRTCCLAISRKRAN